MVAVDTIHGTATNPGATITAVTMATGDSATVRNGRDGSRIYLESVFRNGASAGLVRVRSPLLHDNAQAIRLRGLAASALDLLGFEPEQPLEPQDNLTIEITGGAAESDSALLQLWYEDLPGAQAILKMPEDVLPYTEQLLGCEVATTSPATIGAWADTAINASFDTFKGNRWYAVLGLETDTLISGMAVKGPGTANLRVGMGGDTNRIDTRNRFVQLSRLSGRPHIPIINSADKASTFISTCDKAASTAANVTAILALMPASWNP